MNDPYLYLYYFSLYVTIDTLFVSKYIPYIKKNYNNNYITNNGNVPMYESNKELYINLQSISYLVMIIFMYLTINNIIYKK